MTVTIGRAPLAPADLPSGHQVERGDRSRHRLRCCIAPTRNASRSPTELRGFLLDRSGASLGDNGGSAYCPSSPPRSCSVYRIHRFGLSREITSGRTKSLRVALGLQLGDRSKPAAFWNEALTAGITAPTQLKNRAPELRQSRPAGDLMGRHERKGGKSLCGCDHGRARRS